jgi:hypothetical protein
MTLALHQHKPLYQTDDGRRAVNWPWWLKRVPMALLAIPAAYGVGAFAAAADVPLLVALVAGGAFEAAYIGAIAMADQQHNDDHWTTVLWWLVNLAAVSASVLCNLLFFSGGTYAGITLEVATHAIPLPVLGFFYGLLVHRTSVQAARVAQAESERMPCRYCGVMVKNQAAEYSHFRTCPKHPSRRR